MDLGLSEKACIVTGASRGIGMATARMLAAEGASVLLVARSEDRLARAARECGGRVEALSADVTEAGASDRIVDFCLERFGRVDVLVNNAGTMTAIPPNELQDSDWQDQWELHVLAPMRLMRRTAPLMAEAGWGRIVNVCSSAGKRPTLRNMAYSVTKAAQLSLSRAFAEAWADRGVLVNAVAPGAVGTDLWLEDGGLADQVAAAEGTSRDEVLAGAAAKIPLGRIGEEAEIAAVIAFLCSEPASNVTGAAWSVDGGSFPSII